MFPTQNKKARKSNSQSATDSQHEPVDILVDTIIGYLEKSTAYMRVVGNQVFELLSGVIQSSTMDLILTVRFCC
jgi:DNA polymerase phi